MNTTRGTNSLHIIQLLAYKALTSNHIRFLWCLSSVCNLPSSHLRITCRLSYVLRLPPNHVIIDIYRRSLLTSQPFYYHLVYSSCQLKCPMSSVFNLPPKHCIITVSVVRDDVNTNSSKTQHIKKHKVVNNITLINADFMEKESFEFYIIDISISCSVLILCSQCRIKNPDSLPKYST